MIGYFAPDGLEETLRDELLNVNSQYGRLFLADGPLQKSYWAQNIWLDPQVIAFQSISDAAEKLRSLQKLWVHYPTNLHRRGQLIQQQLPYFLPKPFLFPSKIPIAPLGSFTLIDEHTLLASPHCSSPFAHGEIVFQESKIPPSRAYLKLWEIFTRIGRFPKEGDRCLEIGSSPGSWTWVLQQLGAEVLAVDRAPLDPAIACLPGVAVQQRDAFSIQPEELAGIDWILSDVVCYPEKLLAWIRKCLDAGVSAQWICTIKFQGPIDRAVIDEFAKIEGSQLVHLYHNKHELTLFVN
ncbi:MAG: hypothetical protein HW387_944 [Parachlamydiales bacterium]|nr:hypothetical protein [Parachlamydiales bacterium]